jgi:hypothetical protein
LIKPSSRLTINSHNLFLFKTEEAQTIKEIEEELFDVVKAGNSFINYDCVCMLVPLVFEFFFKLLGFTVRKAMFVFWLLILADFDLRFLSA